MSTKPSRILISLIFFAAGFVVLEVTRRFIGFSSSDSFLVWAWLVFAASMFMLGISVILSFNKKKTLASILFILLVGAIFFVPVPYDLQPIVWVSWYGLLMLVLWAFTKHFKKNEKREQDGPQHAYND
jgi:hypothetical protein